MHLRETALKIRAAYRAQPALWQPTAQLLFIALGITILDFSIGWFDVLAVWLTACATELVLSYTIRGTIPSFRSALSTTFGISMFLRANSIWYLVLAAFVAIGSKYVIRMRGKHIFNPSNLAIVLSVYLLPFATTEQFYEWGDNMWIFLGIALVCLYAGYRIGILSMALSFLGTYAILMGVSLASLPEFFAPHHVGLVSPVLVIFAMFMITDPATSPRGLLPRILFGASVAATFFLLELAGLRYALFASLSLVLLLNALSGLVVGYLRRCGVQLVPNAASFALIFAAILYAYPVHVLSGNGFRAPSLSFLVFGVESSELYACTAPVLRQRDGSGLETPAVTQGAAWSDYDRDGSEDIFVSNWDKPSRLYKNNGNGTFTDVTEQAGLPALSSASAFFADYDNDGAPDLFVADPKAPSPEVSQEHPYGLEISTSTMQAMRVFKNAGGTFMEVTDALGLGSFTWPVNGGASMSFADYDGDGLLDFTIVSRGQFLSMDFGSDSLGRARSDPKFDPMSDFFCDTGEIRKRLSAQPIANSYVRSELDAFYAQPEACILQGVALPLTTDSGTSSAAYRTAPSKTFALLVPGSAHLFRNTGAGFVEVPAFGDYVHELWRTRAAGIRYEGQLSTDMLSGRYFQPVSFDFDGDGRSDIFISLDMGNNLFLKNTGNWTFVDETAALHLNYSGSGMGIGLSDFNKDAVADLFTTNTLDDFLFPGESGGGYAHFLPDIGHYGVGWGTSFLDYNLDGAPDLLIANGDITRTGPYPVSSFNRAFFRADRLYKNVGGSFEDVTWKDFCSDYQSGKALAVADYDNDGDPDAFVGNINAAGGGFHVGSMSFGAISERGNVLYENQTNGPRNTEKHYIEIALRGTRSNRMGIGATIIVHSSVGDQRQYVLAGNSFYSENSQIYIFGLGTDASPVSVEVRWPSGSVTRLADVLTDRRITVTEE
jgi:Na+-translocating ferredoxin:NAD+ oxidoreductase RnfD subunit